MQKFLGKSARGSEWIGWVHTVLSSIRDICPKSPGAPFPLFTILPIVDDGVGVERGAGIR